MSVIHTLGVQAWIISLWVSPHTRCEQSFTHTQTHPESLSHTHIHKYTLEHTQGCPTYPRPIQPGHLPTRLLLHGHRCPHTLSATQTQAWLVHRAGVPSCPSERAGQTASLPWPLQRRRDCPMPPHLTAGLQVNFSLWPCLPLPARV